ncbi:site-specific integrase, partial [Vibrio splendidus]
LRAERMGLEVIATSTGNKYLSRVKCFFEYLKKTGVIERNLFEDIEERKVEERESYQRPAYDENQIKTIISSEVFKKRDLNSYAWVVLIAIETGMRLNEICQLYRENILIKNGVWCIEVTNRREGQRLKNKYSLRLIPISKALIKMGFLDFVKSKDGHLFHDFYYSERDGYSPKMSKWYSKYKKQWRFAEGYCFYSIRHYFTTKLKFSGVPECFVAQIKGHSHKTDTYGRYGKEYSIKAVKKVMDKNTSPSMKNLSRKRRLKKLTTIIF